MKLYNKTKVPDELLERLITRAGIAVGARTSGVVVKVTKARNGRSPGFAIKCNYVHSWHLKNLKCRRGNSKGYSGMRIGTDGGYIQIAFPLVTFSPRQPHRNEWFRKYLTPETRARSFWETCLHEWVHIKDYQEESCWGELPWSERNAKGRRPKHDLRPEEIRANFSAKAAENRLIGDMQIEALIDDLISWIKDYNA